VTPIPGVCTSAIAKAKRKGRIKGVNFPLRPLIHAEQSLRHLVIFRKICFGTRSESGLKTHSILPSLVQTARRQGVHPREFLQTLLTADTPTAQAALYNNSS